MEAVASSPGLRSMAETSSSPPPHACLSSSFSSAPDPPPPGPSTPPPLSSSSAPDPPPPQTPTPLGVAELSASALDEGSHERDINLDVYLATRDCVETVEVTFKSSQTVQDIKEYFEKLKGKDMCSAEKMVIYHDGSKLSDMTLLETVDFENWNDILITDEVDISVSTSGLAPIQEATVDEDLVIPIDYLPSETTCEDLGLLMYENCVLPSTQESVEHMRNHLDCTATIDNDYASTIGQSDIAVISTAITVLPSAETTFSSVETSSAVPETLANLLISTAVGKIPIVIAETAETVLTPVETAKASPAAAETLANLVTSSCSKVLIGRLLIPVTPEDFSDRPLSENQLHGFKTVNELITEINRGPPKWITKKQALGLLYNAELFSVSDVQEDTKNDGLSCVINSTKCQISSTLRGYSAAANVQSSENLIGTMKEKGVEMDWFEVRGIIWSRRRLVLRGGDGVFHLLQWKQHHNTEVHGT